MAYSSRLEQLQRRSKKYAATQYVSETHDHKPDAPAKRQINPDPVRTPDAGPAK